MEVLVVLLLLYFRTVFGVSLDKHGLVRSRDAAAQPCYNAAQSGSICAKQGHLTNADPLGGANAKPFITPDVVFCRAVCVGGYPDYPGAEGCRSLSWDSSTGDCLFYNSTVEDQGLVVGSSNVSYWDYDCFQCLNDCPLNENLFLNPGFEQYPHQIYPWDSEENFCLMLSPGYNSDTAFGMHTTNNQNGNYCAFLYYLYLCPGYYQLTFDYKFRPDKAPNANNVPSIDAQIAQGGVSYDPSKNNTWSQYLGVFKPYVNETKIVQVLTSALLPHLGYLYMDNFNLHRINTPAAVSSAPNLVSNPGFESGDLSSYNFDPTVCKAVSPGHNSNYAAKCNAGPLFDIIQISQTVSTTDKATYIFSFDYKIITYHYRVYCALDFSAFGDFWGASYGVAQVGPAPPSPLNDTWYHFEVTFAVLSTSVNLTLRSDQFYRTRHKTCQYFFDNFKMVEATF